MIKDVICLYQLTCIASLLQSHVTGLCGDIAVAIMSLTTALFSLCLLRSNTALLWAVYLQSTATLLKLNICKSDLFPGNTNVQMMRHHYLVERAVLYVTHQSTVSNVQCTIIISFWSNKNNSNNLDRFSDIAKGLTVTLEKNIE